MDELLRRLDQWVRAHRADYYPVLNPPATPAQLSKLEKVVGKPLPAEFHSLMQWKNGQPEGEYSALHPITNEMFMAISEIITTIKDMRELVKFGDISADLWKNTWIPFMSDGGGRHTCVDAESGNVFIWDHEEETAPEVKYKTIREWLKDLLAVLDTKNFKEWDFDECPGK